jgi:hypothetical protein
MFRYCLKHLSGLRIGHMMKQGHSPVKLSLAASGAGDGKINESKRVPSMVMLLAVGEIGSDEKEYNRKYDS